MEAYPGKPVTAVLHFKGTNLMGDVELELNDADGVFTIDKSSLGQAAAEGGQDILVTYAPQRVGSTVATLVCRSTGADDLTLYLNGTAPLEVYPPVLKSAQESDITFTTLRAAWTDATPATNVEDYTLEVYAKPDYILLEEADFSDLPQMAPTNQASHANDYLPEGWNFMGSEFNLEGGCIMPRRNGVITTDALDLKGYGMVTVVLTGRSYSSWGDPSELTISTSLASQIIELPFSYAPTTVVLDCAEGDKISFTAGYYPMIRAITIYAGDASSRDLQGRGESGDANYRMVTGITGKSYTVKDLAAGGTFFYQVKARYIDGSESPWSATLEVTLHESQQQHQPGDVDHDGSVGIGDVSALVDLLLGNDDGSCCLICADVDDDGEVGISDVSALIDLLLGND